jgi:hypothetical protein
VEEPLLQSVSRRIFLRSSALAAAAMSFGSWPKAVAAPAAASAAGAELTAAHRQTYRSLVEAVARTGKAGVEASRAGEAVGTWSKWYDRRGSDARQLFREILETIERGPGTRRFSSLTADDRLAFLRSWARGEHGALHGKEDRRKSGIALAGASMAASAFHPQFLDPDPENFTKPPLVAL